ncbi:MAG: amphi-Trp domain-containing protein [Halobellus sp.]|uniref:amphi-Trp domain-containing protein n=1 Tax=Halobellus sp. TaxID=1979212 RepID=UPI0035D3F75D
MPEAVLFESESSQDRAAIASYLRDVAAKLEAGDEGTLSAGDRSATLAPPERPTFDVKAEREGPADEQGDLGIEFEIEWHEGDESGSELSVE